MRSARHDMLTNLSLKPLRSISLCNKKQRILRKLNKVIKTCLPKLQSYVYDTAAKKVVMNKDCVDDIDQLLINLKLVEMFEEPVVESVNP